MTSGATFTLSVEGFLENHLRVRAFSGKEAFSDAYSFDIVVTVEGAGDDELERTALAQRAVFTWHLGTKTRAFYGIIAAARLAEVHRASDSVQYHLRFVPRLWLLKKKKCTRVFEKQRVPDIVTAVLLEAGIAVRWQLVRQYPVRDYCTQYEESDYRFVTRLLAESGMYFYFPQGPALNAASSAFALVAGAEGAVGGAVAGFTGSVASAAPVIPGDTVICGDDASGYAPIGGDLEALLDSSSGAFVAEVGSASGDAGSLPRTKVEGLAAPPLHYLATQQTATSPLDKVTRFALQTKVKSNAAMYRDFDPARPMVRMTSTASSTQPFPASALEVAAAAASATASAASSGIPGSLGNVEGTAASAAMATGSVVDGLLGQRAPNTLEVYDHHGPFLFPQWGFANDEAPRILRQKRRRVAIADGDSGSPDLGPGHRFTLCGHPAGHLDGAYVVTSVEHRGQMHAQGDGGEWKVYSSSFECAPAVVAYIPRRPERKSVQVSLTATVVGPPGEEIHVDPMGQIRVQFHWDRAGRYDDRSSCWIRTMHPWGGVGWGVQFIPRVGMEVVVVFEGGDPDKPMVIGTLYNGTHPPPFVLPGDKTRSGFKSRSTPASEGFNELSFEDAAGAELLTLRAEKNLHEAVGHDRESVVGHDRTTTVQGASREEVRGSRTRTVGGGEAVTIRGASTFAVDGARTETINGTVETRTQGDREVSTGGDENSEIGGDRKATVCGSDHVIAKVARSVIVGTSTERRGDSLNFVWGRATHRTSGVSELVGDEAIVLRSGKSTIEILPDRIRITAPTIETVATKEVVMRGGGDGGPVLKLTDRAEIMAKEMNFISESARLSLKKNASVRGEKILLNSDEQGLTDATGEAVAPDTVKVALRLFDDDQEPYADKDYCIVVGSITMQGKTDGTGRMSATVPAIAKTGRITVWKADFPTGPTQEWVLSLEPMGAADSPPDLQKRLANLGFPSGPPVTELTPRLREALRAYQTANQLDVTGEADPETVALLHIIHP